MELLTNEYRRDSNARESHPRDEGHGVPSEMREDEVYLMLQGSTRAPHHGTFFNMVPTNHKFYGYQDLNAFQNLTNLYGQFRFRPHPKIGMTFDAHLFRLSNTADAWYGGSGPANNQAFGYVARRPTGGDELDSDIGTELDFTAVWNAHPKASFQFGASHFRGGEVAQTIFPVKHNFTWIYINAILRY